MLPDSLPAHFQATYTPIAAAGTPGQIKHLARLLATQLTMAGMGKGINEVQRMVNITAVFFFFLIFFSIIFLAYIYFFHSISFYRKIGKKLSYLLK